MTLVQDIRYALRSFRHHRGFSTLAVLTLALGIGTTTAVFTVVNGVLLRPLPYRFADRLVLLTYGPPGRVSPWLSPLNYQDYVGQSRAFDAAAAVTPTTANLTGGGDPERVSGSRVTPDFFDVLGVEMALGRPLRGDDTDVVVLSDRFWRRRFGARGDIIGRTVTLDGHAYTVIGVAPAGTKFPATAEFWRPLIFSPHDTAPDARGAQWVQVVARLKPDVSSERGAGAISQVAQRLAREYPDTERDAMAGVIALHERVVRTIRPALLMLLGAVTIVLVIACVNVAGLLTARGVDRRHELAVRAALGAGRGRIVRQLLVESAVLGCAGAAAGIPLAYWLVGFALERAPATLPRATDIRIDASVLGFTMLAGLVTSIAFGLAPAILAAPRPRSDGPSRGVIGASRRRGHHLLVSAEIALAAVLLGGAGLLLRSYQRVQAVDPGFDASRTTTFSLSLPNATYVGATERSEFTSQLLERLEATPGVESAAAAMGMPFSGDLNMFTRFRAAGVAGGQPPNAALRIVTADYFRTARLVMRRGRAFEPRDTATSAEVVIVNQRLADRYFPGQNPIGRQVEVSISLVEGARNGPKTIVGVVGNVKSDALEDESPAEIYIPYAQEPVSDFTVLVRGANDHLPEAASLRRAVAGLDAELPLANLRPFAEMVDASLASRRFAMLLVTGFAVLAAVLAAIGIYGVVSHVVAQRTAEIGVRVAVGARPRDIARLFAREGFALGAAGLATGLVGAVGAGRVLSTSLYGVSPSDPATLAVVTLVLAVAALLAMIVPVWRALRVDPTTALRSI
jgi:predicted permease